MRRIAALATAGVVLLVLVAAQLLLPGIAAQHLRDQLEKSGTVLEVKVSAFPAIKLLWHRADSVVVRMGTYRSGVGHLGSTLAGSSDAGKIDASAQRLEVGPLTLLGATLRKRGSQLTGAATVNEENLRSAVFFLDNVEPIASGDGRLTLRGTASFLGLRATVDATVAAQDGALVVAPDVPFGGIATLTLFHDPHVQVQSVSATTVPGGFRITADGKVQ
ncbi:MAG TPA: LmeA family phospholipid-binding protein [Solirubrobacteraceae bacterium]|nr:LmeA family phospholipid-binding protein [Solirubrobacteraceae bacterium]